MKILDKQAMKTCIKNLQQSINIDDNDYYWKMMIQPGKKIK